MARGLQSNRAAQYGLTRLPVSSVASGSSVVASLRSFQTTRGPSAPADNTAEHTTPFSMLLDANTPPVDSKPAPRADRSARADSRPDHNPPATNDQPTDTAPVPTQKNAGTTDSRGGKTKDDSSKTGNAADDAKDTGDSKDGANAADQSAADSTSAGGQVATAQIVAGPVIAPVLPVADATTTQTADSSNGACVAPAATPPIAPALFSTALDGATPGPSTPDDQSADTANPAQTTETNASVAPANTPAPATSAARPPSPSTTRPVRCRPWPHRSGSRGRRRPIARPGAGGVLTAL